MNFSSISTKSAFGKLLRLPLMLIPPEMKLPILQGRLKGCRWIVGSSNHGCWLGSYEWDMRRAFEETVGVGSVVFDIGAHVGFYTLLASLLVGPEGKVFAFEPDSRNVYYLMEHLRINRVANAEVIEAAVFDRTGTASFYWDASSSQSHLGPERGIEVKTVSLDELVESKEAPLPDYIKIDVEGAEMEVLTGGERMLGEAHPIILIETHGPDLHRRCFGFLNSLGYQVKSISFNQLIAFCLGR